MLTPRQGVSTNNLRVRCGKIHIALRDAAPCGFVGTSAEAKPLFEKAVEANPNLAEAWYMLGMSSAGSDLKLARTAMEKYLQLAPSGPNAAMAKQLLDALPT